MSNLDPHTHPIGPGYYNKRGVWYSQSINVPREDIYITNGKIYNTRSQVIGVVDTFENGRFKYIATDDKAISRTIIEIHKVTKPFTYLIPIQSKIPYVNFISESFNEPKLDEIYLDSRKLLITKFDGLPTNKPKTNTRPDFSYLPTLINYGRPTGIDQFGNPTYTFNNIYNHNGITTKLLNGEFGFSYDIETKRVTSPIGRTLPSDYYYIIGELAIIDYERIDYDASQKELRDWSHNDEININILDQELWDRPFRAPIGYGGLKHNETAILPPFGIKNINDAFNNLEQKTILNNDYSKISNNKLVNTNTKSKSDDYSVELTDLFNKFSEKMLPNGEHPFNLSKFNILNTQQQFNYKTEGTLFFDVEGNYHLNGIDKLYLQKLYSSSGEEIIFYGKITISDLEGKISIFGNDITRKLSSRIPTVLYNIDFERLLNDGTHPSHIKYWKYLTSIQQNDYLYNGKIFWNINGEYTANGFENKYTNIFVIDTNSEFIRLKPWDRFLVEDLSSEEAFIEKTYVTNFNLTDLVTKLKNNEENVDSKQSITGSSPLIEIVNNQPTHSLLDINGDDKSGAKNQKTASEKGKNVSGGGKGFILKNGTQQIKAIIGAHIEMTTNNSGTGSYGFRARNGKTVEIYNGSGTVFIASDNKNFKQQVNGRGELRTGLDYNQYIGQTCDVKIGKDDIRLVKENSIRQIGKSHVVTINDHEYTTTGKNLIQQVGENFSLQVVKSATTEVGENYSLKITKSMNLGVAKDMSYKVGKGAELNVGDDLDIKVGNNIVANADENINIKSGEDLSVDVGDNLNFRVKNDCKMNVGDDFTIDASSDASISAGTTFTVDSLMCGINGTTLVSIGSLLINITATTALNLTGDTVVNVKSTGVINLTAPVVNINAGQTNINGNTLITGALVVMEEVYSPSVIRSITNSVPFHIHPDSDGPPIIGT